MYYRNTTAICKALAIMAVVLWHCQPSVGLGKALMFFGVPMFFFVSGYHFKTPENIRQLLQYIKRRILRLYIPFVKWSLIFLLFHNLFFKIHLYEPGYDGCYPYNASDYLYHFTGIICKISLQDRLLGPLWFLNTLFFSSIGVSVALWLLRGWKRWGELLLLILLLSSAVLSKYYIDAHHLMPMISFTSMGGAFFLAGKICKEHPLTPRMNNIVTVLSLLVSVGGWLFYDKVVEMTSYQWQDMLPFFFISVAMVMVVRWISEKLLCSPLATPLSYVGNHTLIILVLHPICFKLVSLIKIKLMELPIERLADFPIIENNTIFFTFAYFTAGILIPLFLNHLWTLAVRK